MFELRSVRGVVALGIAWMALAACADAAAQGGAIEAAATEELPPAVFAARRAKLVAELGADAVAVLSAPPLVAAEETGPRFDNRNPAPPPVTPPPRIR